MPAPYGKVAAARSPDLQQSKRQQLKYIRTVGIWALWSDGLLVDLL